jgi:hypothetical protein
VSVGAGGGPGGGWCWAQGGRGLLLASWEEPQVGFGFFFCSVQYNKFTAAGAQHLAASLRKCPHVETLA